MNAGCKDTEVTVVHEHDGVGTIPARQLRVSPPPLARAEFRPHTRSLTTHGGLTDACGTRIDACTQPGEEQIVDCLKLLRNCTSVVRDQTRNLRSITNALVRSFTRWLCLESSSMHSTELCACLV